MIRSRTVTEEHVQIPTVHTLAMQYKYSRLIPRTGKPCDCSATNDRPGGCCVPLLYLAVSHGASQFSRTFVACDIRLVTEKEPTYFIRGKRVI